MAILINQTSNLRLRLSLSRRLSDGVLTPAALEMGLAVERYRHVAPAGGQGEPGQGAQGPGQGAQGPGQGAQGPGQSARGPGVRKEHGFVALLEVPKATLLDLDLINFLQSLESLLEGEAAPPPGALPPGVPPPGGPDAPPRMAALEASVDPSIGLRILGGPDACLIEVGVDLLNVLEPLGGQQGERGADLALFRFAANRRAVIAFCAGLIEEFQRFPTDPSKVAKGAAS